MPMKLMKKKKGGKIALSFASPEKEKYYYFIYDVITWEKILKRSSIYYSGGARKTNDSRRHSAIGKAT
jgi:hypothetical protein